MSQSRFAAIILAAGNGTRMKSAIPKVMHPIAGRPMIGHLLDALQPLSPAATVVVIGPQMDAVARTVAPAESVVQDPPLGTGDAVQAALKPLEGRLAPHGDIDEVLVLYGDTPFLATETLSRLLAERRRTAAAILVSGMRPADPGAYGRLVLAADGTLERIVEAADASPEERAIGLVNGGIMAIAARHLCDLVDALDTRQRQGRILPDRHRPHCAPQAAPLPHRRAARRGIARDQHPRRAGRGRGADAAPAAPRSDGGGGHTDRAGDRVPQRRYQARPRCRHRAERRLRSRRDGRRGRADPLVLASRGRRGRSRRDRRARLPGCAPARCSRRRSMSAILSRSRRPGSAPASRPITSPISATARSGRGPISAPARSPAITTALTNSAR